MLEAVTPGLRAGTVHAFAGGTTLGIALMAGASMNGSWCAAVGFPDLGLESAADWGVDLERLVLVPRPGAREWLNTVSTLIEAVDVVLACPPPPMTAGPRARLHARLRHRGATLLVQGEWPQAASSYLLADTRWRGLEQGHGHLSGRDLHVVRTHGHRRSEHVVTCPASS